MLHPPDEQRHIIRRIQRDYVAQWVDFLSRVCPELDHTDALLTVHGVLGMVNNVLRIARFRNRPRLADELVAFSRLLLLGP